MSSSSTNTHVVPDAEQLERILFEVGRQILERGLPAGDPLGGFACTSLRLELCPDSAGRVLEAGACRLGVHQPPARGMEDVARHIDHTLLKANATLAEIEQLCQEAKTHGFASVCVNGLWVRRCAELLAGTPVAVCTVVGFPLGASAPEVKAFEARRAIEDGACEVDMVLSVGALKSGQDDFVRADIAAVREVCRAMGAKLKVILETCLLTDDEKVRACRAAVAAGADFVKTSTGFSTGGATVADVELMRRVVGPAIGVKASGGVRTRDDAKAMLAAGATRLGASASVAIATSAKGPAGGY